MIQGFLRPKTDMDMSLSSWSFHPGETIDVKLSFTALERCFVREGRIELVCTELYFLPPEQGPYGRAFEQRETIDEVFASERFLADTDCLVGIPYQSEASLLVPENARPSVNGELAHVSWHCRVVVDIAYAGDIDYSQEVIVLNRERATSPSTSQRWGEDGCLILELPSDQIRLGDRVNGVLRVKAINNLRFHQVRLELSCTQEVGRVGAGFLQAEKKILEKVEDKAVFRDPTRLLADQEFAWNFELKVPEEDLLPSTATGYTVVGWKVKGVLDRRMHFDYYVDKEIQVYSG